ncbi:uncharacterized protein N7477_008775 [Penicillium maclennaniae]|uniref:uncharacterized protein n=1 Tax=Penicillium maclennaniae TaxID=1343394 RepID=UPI002542402F|nr:uncharacterized protein N7477_008775 [Penicillium maclennaniae]KAJ5666327.1 hypothetical protein N7477_008775 [Penicillium maclennaniae]
MFSLHFARSAVLVSDDVSPASPAAVSPALSSLETTFGAGTQSWHVVLTSCGIVVFLALVVCHIAWFLHWNNNRYIPQQALSADASLATRQQALTMRRESWLGQFLARYRRQPSAVNPTTASPSAVNPPTAATPNPVQGPVLPPTPGDQGHTTECQAGPH